MIFILLLVLLPVQTAVHGLTYEQWAERWWSWYLNNEAGICDMGQYTTHQRPVFFLAGYNNTENIVKEVQSCDIPANQTVLFPIITGMCPYNDEKTKQESLDHCKGGLATSLFLNVDGTKYQKEDLAKYRIFTADNKLPVGDAAVHGYFVALKLSEGTHYLHIVAEDTHGFEVDTTYYLTVK